jgi:hypothetical protein
MLRSAKQCTWEDQSSQSNRNHVQPAATATWMQAHLLQGIDGGAR